MKKGFVVGVAAISSLDVWPVEATGQSAVSQPLGNRTHRQPTSLPGATPRRVRSTRKRSALPLLLRCSVLAGGLLVLLHGTVSLCLGVAHWLQARQVTPHIQQLHQTALTHHTQLQNELGELNAKNSLERLAREELDFSQQNEILVNLRPVG